MIKRYLSLLLVTILALTALQGSNKNEMFVQAQTTTTAAVAPFLNISFYNSVFYSGSMQYGYTYLNYPIPVGLMLNATFTVSPSSGLNFPSQLYFNNANYSYGYFVFTPTAAGNYTVNVNLVGSAAGNYTLASASSFVIQVKAPGNVLVSNFSYIKTQGDSWTVTVALDSTPVSAPYPFNVYISTNNNYIYVNPYYVILNSTAPQTFTFTAVAGTPVGGTTLYFYPSDYSYALPANLANGFTMFVTPTTAAPTTSTATTTTTTTTAGPTTTTTTSTPTLNITFWNTNMYLGQSYYATTELNYAIPVGQVLNATFTVSPATGLNLPNQIYFVNSNSTYGWFVFTPTAAGTYTVNVALSGSAAANYALVSPASFTITVKSPGNVLISNFSYIKTQGDTWTVDVSLDTPLDNANNYFSLYLSASYSFISVTPNYITFNATTLPVPTQTLTFTALGATPAYGTTIYFSKSGIAWDAYNLPSNLYNGFTMFVLPTTAAPTTTTTAGPTTSAAPTTTTTAAPTAAPTTTTTAVPQVQITWVNPVQCDGTTSNVANIYLTQPIPAGQTLNINFFPPAGIQIPTQIALTSNNSQYHAVYYTASNGGTIDVTLSGTSAGGFFNLYYPNNYVTLGCVATTAAPTAAPTTAAPTTAAPTTAAPTTAAPTTAAPTTAAPTTAAPTTAAPTTAAPTTAAPTTAAPTTAAPTTAAPTTAAPTTTTAAPTTTTTAVPQVQFTWVNPVRCDGVTSNRAEIFLTQRIPAGQTLNINFFPPAGIQIPTQIALTSNNSQYHAVYYTASNGGTIDITLSGTSAGGFFNLDYPNNYVTLGCAATTTTTRPPTTTTTLAPTTTTSSLFPLDVDAIRITVFFGNTNCNRNKGTNLTATYSLNRCDKIGVIRTGGTYETAWTRTVCNGTSASFQIHTDKCLTSPELSLSYPIGVCHHNGVQSQLIECIKRASAGATSFALVLVSIVAIIFSVLMM